MKLSINSNVEMIMIPKPNVSVSNKRNEVLPTPVPVVAVQNVLVPQELRGEAGGEGLENWRPLPSQEPSYRPRPNIVEKY